MPRIHHVAATPVQLPEARGLRHLAFATPDLDAEGARLTALGVVCEPRRIHRPQLHLRRPGPNT
uniref:hypothetical protein n=1 Tax=uncultured Caulobacter sp. TaxID=158749 RepID=UPI0025DC7434|nr:hypothetical protein [uncultured Caulobacter sp.]